MAVTTFDDFRKYREQNTRPIACPDGQTRQVTLSLAMWEHLEFCVEFEMPLDEIAGWALNEAESHGCDFTSALQSVIAFMVNQWTVNE